MPFIYGNIGAVPGTGGGTVSADDVVLFTVDENEGELEASSETVTLRKTDRTQGVDD